MAVDVLSIIQPSHPLRRHHASIAPLPYGVEEDDAEGTGQAAGATNAWWRRFRRRAAQWVYAEAEEEKLPMLRQHSSTSNGRGSSSGSPPRRGGLLLPPGAEPGMYLSPRARAALLRSQEREASEQASAAPPVRLPRSLPEAYHSIAVPRARPGV